MESTSQFGVPALIAPDSGEVQPLEHVSLNVKGEGRYDERWLQDLLHSHPSLIPTEELEPAFAGAIPVCRELPTGVGPLDLVFINSQGLLTLVECKLWRNPEARRKVVGQILDYAQEISRWSYDELEIAIRRSKTPAAFSLWAIARTAFNLDDEATFIDRVSRHLRTGTFLLLVVGDGIRENTENITAFLQRHASLSFAFGLVEERLFRIPNSEQIFVQPRILAKTVEIGRFIVRAEAGAPVITREETTMKTVEPTKGRTVTEAVFIEEVAGNSTLAEQIRNFFTRLKEANLDLKPTTGHAFKIVPNGTAMNLLNLARNGTVRNYGCGDTPIGRSSLEELKLLFPQAQIKEGGSGGWYSTVKDRNGNDFRLEDVVPLEKPLITLFLKTGDQLRAAAEQGATIPS